MIAATGPLIVAVGGGKGGVGKSVVSANLAIALSRLGAHTVLVDADLGSANQHTLFGIDRPGLTLQGLIDRSVESLEEVVVPTLMPRLFLVPGSGAVSGAANVTHAQKLKLLRHIRGLSAEIVVIDCGAGVSFNVLDFFSMADVRILVATPQLISLQNAYGFLKSAVYRMLRHSVSGSTDVALFEEACTGVETERMYDFMERVRTRSPELAASLERTISVFDTLLVGNMLEHGGQKQSILALSRMIADFLGVNAHVRSTLPMSPRLHASVTKRRPLLSENITGEEGRALMTLAEAVLRTDLSRIRTTRQLFSERPSKSPSVRPGKSPSVRPASDSVRPTADSIAP